MGSANTMAERLKRLEKIFGGSELKYLKVEQDSTVDITGVPQLFYLNDMARGDTVQSREGDRCKFTRFQLNGLLKSANNNIIRILIGLVKNHDATSTMKFNAASPATGYLFMNNPAVPGTVNVYSQYNLNNTSVKDDYAILFDEVYVLSTTNQFQTPIKIDLPLWFSTEYKGGDFGDPRDITKNLMFMAIWGSGTATGGDLDYAATIYFTDLA